MGDLFDLARMVRAKADKLEKSVSDVTVEIASEMVSDLAHNTPVDTSQALSSWIASLDEPSQVVGKPHYPGHKGSTQLASAAATAAAADRVLTDRRPGQTIYIVNNQPYIRDLDAGTISRQPGNFVALAMARARIRLRSIVLKW